MKTKISGLIGLVLLGAAAAGMLAGCDTSSNDDRQIAIMPESVSFTNFIPNLSYVQTFTAGDFLGSSGSFTNGTLVTSTNLYYPLEWRVSDPRIGIIVESTGNSAVYRTYPNIAGLNIIYCRDQSGREGQATAISTFPIPTNTAESAE